MKIAVVGSGYVGLVTGTCFAETGNHVTCIDIDHDKVEKMRNGEIPIYEPGLEPIFQRNIEQDRLNFTTELVEGIQGAQVIFLALPTPPGEDGSADLRYVLQVAEKMGPYLEDYTVIVDKSTVPVGTSEKVRDKVATNCNCEFDVVSNPEFLREGSAIDDFMKPERVIIGTSSEKAQEVMDHLYQPFVRQGNPILFMDERSAEMTKYAANAFLATKISFMNEIANLCEKVGANVDAIRKGIGTDERIGKRFLFAGIGYGGSCFPKDVQAIANTAQEHSYDFKILNSVMETNQNQKTSLIPKIKRYYNNDLKGKNITLWGLAFKPNTDDIREAPALFLIEELLKEGANIKAFDPEAMKNVKAIYGDQITYASEPYEALEDSDALLLVTEWHVFRNPDFNKVKSAMKNPVIFDGRNVYVPEEMEEKGFFYESIGRRTITSKVEY